MTDKTFTPSGRHRYVCPSCTRPVTPDARYCPKCGYTLPHASGDSAKLIPFPTAASAAGGETRGRVSADPPKADDGDDSATRMVDSDDPDVLEGRAEVLEQKRKLIEAKQPLVDRLIMRGLIPLALAIVGPWALYTFNVDNKETRDKVEAQGAVAGELKKLLDKATAERSARLKDTARWRERMKKIEAGRAAELVAMVQTVKKLDDTLKMALLHMVILRVVREQEEDAEPRGPKSVVPRAMRQIDQKRALRDIQAQMPNVASEEVHRRFRRFMRERAKK